MDGSKLAATAEMPLPDPVPSGLVVVVESSVHADTTMNSAARVRVILRIGVLQGVPMCRKWDGNHGG